jgi:uncharacterized protein (DUF362 family)/Pyruvate/2-oxoacid:ferredoxin oxidoreductase delta subunit
VSREQAIAGADRRASVPVANVSSARCISHTIGCVRPAVQKCLGDLPGMEDIFRAADRVLLKPNLLSSTSGPGEHVNTHPSTIFVLAELLQSDFGCEVWIGDSCGTFSQDSTARALSNSGMASVAEQTGARLYNVDAEPRAPVRCDRAVIYTDIPLPRTLAQFDVIVSVAKLKTHMLTYVTGPVKNMFGLVPGAAKKRAHMLAPHPLDFATLLCDLYSVLPPMVAFVDGVVGMEGRGPKNGPLRHVELLAASSDPVALDSYCAQVMGFDPMRVPLLAECSARRLGTVRPADIAVWGPPAEAFAPTDFAKPPTFLASRLAAMVPPWLVRGALLTFASRYARIDQERCIRCGECARNCPSGAISADPEAQRHSVDRRLCISCYCCAEVCPSDAIKVEPTRPARAAAWLRARRRRTR